MFEAGDMPSGQVVSYSYDVLGRRANRVANGVTTTFQYDAVDVVIDRGSDGSAFDYLNGLGIDDKLRQTGGIGGTLYFLQDHLGSTSALTSSTGALLEQQQYEAFGANTGSTQTRYGYTGRERDELTGLMYYRARWYDSQQGRFLSEDPLGLSSGLNHFIYVDDNPLNNVDPFGLQKKKSQEECNKLIEKIRRFTNKINTTWKRLKDAGFIDRGGKKRPDGSTTKPFGHYEKLENDQRGLANRLLEWLDDCWDDCDPPPSIPKEIDDAFKAIKLIPPMGFPSASRAPIAERSPAPPKPSSAPTPLPGTVPHGNIDLNAAANAGAWAAAGAVLYWVISEGSRIIFPPRNLIPIP